jgi:hypothetical protein
MRFLAIRIKNEDAIPMFYTWNPCGYVSDGVNNSGSMPQKKGRARDDALARPQ